MLHSFRLVEMVATGGPFVSKLDHINERDYVPLPERSVS